MVQKGAEAAAARLTAALPGLDLPSWAYEEASDHSGSGVWRLWFGNRAESTLVGVGEDFVQVRWADGNEFYVPLSRPFPHERNYTGVNERPTPVFFIGRSRAYRPISVDPDARSTAYSMDFPSRIAWLAPPPR